MSRYSIAIVCSVLLVLSTVALPAHSQNASTEAKPPSGGPRRQLATILYAGLGGAVFGLSTLSFYGRPQDKLANIAIGFAIGVMAGTAVVTYGAATNPDEFYGTEPSGQEAWRYTPEFDHSNVAKGPAVGSDFLVNYGFDF